MKLRPAVCAMLLANALMLLAPPNEGPKSARVIMPRRTLAEMVVLDDVSLLVLFDSRAAHPEAAPQSYLAATRDNASANPPSEHSAASTQAT